MLYVKICKKKSTPGFEDFIVCEKKGKIIISFAYSIDINFFIFLLVNYRPPRCISRLIYMNIDLRLLNIKGCMILWYKDILLSTKYIVI